jgi:hypothetical protein
MARTHPFLLIGRLLALPGARQRGFGSIDPINDLGICSNLKALGCAHTLMDRPMAALLLTDLPGPRRRHSSR